MKKGPRAITKAIHKLDAVSVKLHDLANELRYLADDLQRQDARETRLDPRLRRKVSRKRPQIEEVRK